MLVLKSVVEIDETLQSIIQVFPQFKVSPRVRISKKQTQVKGLYSQMKHRMYLCKIYTHTTAKNNSFDSVRVNTTFFLQKFASHFTFVRCH